MSLSQTHLFVDDTAGILMMKNVFWPIKHKTLLQNKIGQCGRPEDGLMEILKDGKEELLNLQSHKLSLIFFPPLPPFTLSFLHTHILLYRWTPGTSAY